MPDDTVFNLHSSWLHANEDIQGKYREQAELTQHGLHVR